VTHRLTFLPPLGTWFCLEIWIWQRNLLKYCRLCEMVFGSKRWLNFWNVAWTSSVCQRS
jgi:hypothetical protein